MKQVLLELPTLAFVVGTRAALAAGAGLLLSARLPEDRRRTIGKALVAIGAVTTIPAVRALVQGVRRARRGRAGSRIEHDPAVRGATRFPRKGDDEVLPPLWEAADREDIFDAPSIR